MWGFEPWNIPPLHRHCRQLEASACHRTLGRTH